MNRRSLSYVVLFIDILICMYIALSNPDMTETRLLITFWKEYLVLGAIAGLCGYFSKY